MAEQKETQDQYISEIKKNIAEQKVIIGTKRTLKALRSNTVSTVYLTQNTPEELKETVCYYSERNNVSVNQIQRDK